MDEGIYDHEEYAKAMAWTEKNCKTNEGEDFKNRPEKRKTREQKDADWEGLFVRVRKVRQQGIQLPDVLCR